MLSPLTLDMFSPLTLDMLSPLTLDMLSPLTLDMFSPLTLDMLSPLTLAISDCRLTPREFNSYGSRRGNDSIMARGTFANIRLVNKFLDKAGPRTKHWPSGDVVRQSAGILQNRRRF